MKKPLAVAFFLLLTLAGAELSGSGLGLLAQAMSPKRSGNETPASSKSGRVWIVRGDGAQSCGMKEGESVEAGAEALQKEGIRTFGSMKGNDGMMHVQVCGAPKGSLNGYWIDAKDLPRAIALGFKEAPSGFANPGK